MHAEGAANKDKDKDGDDRNFEFDDDDDDMKCVGRLARGILTNAHKPLSRCTDMLHIVVVIVLIIIVIIITSIIMYEAYNKKKTEKIGSAEPYDDDEYDNDKSYEYWILWIIIQALINSVNSTIMAKYEVTFDLEFMTIHTRPL